MDHLLTRRDRLWTYGSITVGCLLWAAAIAALLWLGGCSMKGWNPLSVFGGGKKMPTPPPSAEPFWFLTWIAGGLALFGAIALVASFVVPLIPRKAAVVSIVCAVAFGIAKAFLDKFLGVMLWGAFGLLIVGGAFALWPWIKAAQNWSLDRMGKRLAKDDPRAGVALMATARGLTKPNGKHKEWRKALLARVDQTSAHQPV